MQANLKEISQNIEYFRLYKDYEAGRKYADQILIPQLLAALQEAQDGKAFIERGLKRCADTWAEKENNFIARIELLISIVQQHEEKNAGLKSTIKWLNGIVKELQIEKRALLNVKRDFSFEATANRDIKYLRENQQRAENKLVETDVKLQQSQDRERVLREALTKILQRESYIVETFENGQLLGKITHYSGTGNIAMEALNQEVKP